MGSVGSDILIKIHDTYRDLDITWVLIGEGKMIYEKYFNLEEYNPEKVEAFSKSYIMDSGKVKVLEEDLEKIIYIRNQGHTVLEAINRQLAHYPYHVGQIVFLGKMILNDKWQTLSIARGKSTDYNAEKFSKEKHTEHFTDEYLKSRNDEK